MNRSRALVVDASAAITLLAQLSAGERVAAELYGRAVSVPASFDAEVLHGLKNLERSGKIDARRMAAALDDLESLPFRRMELPPLARDAWSLRHNLSLYDAFYVALARAARCPVLTTDRKWERAGELGVAILTIR